MAKPPIMTSRISQMTSVLALTGLIATGCAARDYGDLPKDDGGPNKSDAVPAFPEQTRAPEARTNVTLKVETIADGIAFDGVRCGNDDLASQAFLALSEHRLASTVQLVGQDADLAACQRIVEGTQLMTVYKPVEKLAKEAAEIVVQLARGEKPQFTDTIYDGTYDVPYQKLVPIMVTRENIDEVIIDGGFHRREQVYLNLD